MAKFKEPLADNSFNRRMAQGHVNRTGHKLEAHQVSNDGVLWHTVRECCGEVEPETLAVWS